MPSVHVAWAVLIGWAVVRVSTSKWRWVALAHPVLTIFVITATANHFWLDGIVAIAVLAACVWSQRVAARAVRTRAVRRALRQADAVPEGVGATDPLPGSRTGARALEFEHLSLLPYLSD